VDTLRVENLLALKVVTVLCRVWAKLHTDLCYFNAVGSLIKVLLCCLLPAAWLVLKYEPLAVV